MEALTSCGNCSEEITADSDFCPHCGVLFAEAGGLVCERHSEQDAVGVCIICRVLVCDKCRVVVGNRTFCFDHSMTEVQQNWANVFQSTDINEAELVKSLLEASNFHIQVQNFGSIGFVWEGGSDSSLSRNALNKPAKLFVPIPQYLKAVETVEQWKTSGQSNSEQKV
jgi:RNA polymerase subunit RPABC4/transcription elongation factor Spt4